MAELESTFDDRDGWIWFDGEIVPWRDAKVHVLTHALHYASSVFEGQRNVLSSVLAPIERGTYRLLRIDPTREQTWLAYDFEPVHNVPGTPNDRVYLYADGHCQ